eukprot:368342-Karenia_brevis.AAC.1
MTQGLGNIMWAFAKAGHASPTRFVAIALEVIAREKLQRCPLSVREGSAVSGMTPALDQANEECDQLQRCHLSVREASA